MRLVDIDALRDRIDALETLPTFKDSPSWPTYTHRTNDIDDVLDEAPVVMQWHKPSEELPKLHRDILFVTKDEYLHFGHMELEGWFTNYWSDEDYVEDDVTAWCYAPSLPEWCEEE